MAVWLIPTLKAVLPRVGTIIYTAAPVFTKKKTDAVANQMVLLPQQITELQSATSQFGGRKRPKRLAILDL